MTAPVKVLIGVFIVIVVLLLVARLFLTTGLTKDDLSQFAYSTLTLPNGTSVNYRVQGNSDGVPLLLIHGGGDSLDTWQPWAERLTDYKTISVDLPGHGLTDPDPDKAYGRWMFAQFVRDFADALELQRFVIGGNSYGGETALRFVIDNPGRATAMVLVSSGGYLGEAPETEAEMLEMVNSPLRSLMPYLTSREAIRDSLDEYLLPAAITPELVDRMYWLSRYEKNRSTFYDMIAYAAETYRDIEGLDEIDIPVLLLWGKHDKVTPPDMGRRFDQEISNSKLIIYENAGHVAMVENPDESAQDVRQFLLENGIGIGLDSYSP